jgi:hypothetical protein
MRHLLYLHIEKGDPAWLGRYTMTERDCQEDREGA